MSRLGKSLITDTELLSLDRLGAEIDAVTPEAVSELAGDPARAGALFGRGNRAERGLVPGRGRARESRAGRRHRARRGVRILLNGRSGKVGSVLAPALEAAGHELVDEHRRGGRDGRLHGARRGAPEHPGRDRSGRPVGGRNERLGHRSRARRARPGLLCPELRDRGRPDDAVCRGSGPPPSRGGDRRAPPRDEASTRRPGRRRRRPSGCPTRRLFIPSGCRASSRTRRCCWVGKGRC